MARTIEDAKKRIEQALSLGQGVLDMRTPSVPLNQRPVGPVEGTASEQPAPTGTALDWIIKHESGGKTSAKNKSSSAFGLGQLLIGNRKKYGAMFGFDPNTTDYNQQLKMMQQYITDRYKTPEAAQAFWQQHGWY